jgi:hypothetical protein
MSKKRVSYQNLLKQAIAEYDTSNNLQVKGPMLDPILSWDGGGELPTYKDAASILERYYFDQDADKGVEVSEADYENDKGEKGKGMEDAKGTGTEQAGTSASGSVKGGLADKEELIAKEQDESDAEEKEEKADEKEEEKDEEKVEEAETNDKDVPPAKKYDEENMTTEDIENAVIEKLIAEMEEDDEEEKDEEKDEEKEEKEVEEAEVMTYTKEGPKEEAPKEKVSKGPEEDAQGTGTQQAGTGDANGQVPNRKDVADKMVKPKAYNEQDDEATPPKPGEEGDEGDEELDVDKKMEEIAPPPAASAVPGGPGPDKEDDDDDAVSEAFELFKEQIEEDE